MADAVQVQKELDTLQKFALLLEIDQDTEYLAVVETQLTQVYGSRLAEAIGRDKYDQLMANPDQLDRVLGLLEQIRQVLIADEHADWRGALEENVRLLEEKRKQEIETKIAEEKTVSLADARTKLVKTLTPLLPYADPDIIELAADMVVLNCADRPEEALVEAVRTIDIISSTTGVDIAIDPLAIANALEPAAPVLEITYPEFQEVAAQIAAEFAVQSPVDTSSAAFVYTTNLITTAAYAGLPNTVIDISKNTQKIESLALQFLKIPQAAQVTQILSQPQLQLPKLFQSIKQEISAQSQFNKAVDKHVKLSGASKEEQKIAAEVIKRYVMPPVSVIYSLAETPEEKQSLAKSAFQKFATQIGLDQYSRGARVRMASISQAVYFQVQSFPYADFQSLMLHRRTLKSGSPASPYMEMFFGQMQNMITDKVAKEVINKAATSLGIKLGTQAAVTAGAEVAVEAGVVAAGAATGPPGWVVAAAAIVVGFAKDIISKSSRWVRENWPVLVGALAGLVGGIFAGFAPVGIAVAGFVGGVGGTALTQGGVSRIGSGASRFFNGIAGLAVTEIATPIIVIVMSVPIVIALILFIINNSAYIVPQAVGTISGGGGPTTQINCFIIDGFSEPAATYVTNAINTIVATNYGQKLCSGGNQIFVHSAAQQYLTNADDSFVLDANGNKIPFGGRAPVAERNQIYLFPFGTSSQNSATFTLAHESGHVFSQFFGAIYDQFDLSNISQLGVEGYLPSYKFGFSVYEDFAETVGIGIRFGTDYFLTEFNKLYSLHKQFFDNILNAP